MKTDKIVIPAGSIDNALFLPVIARVIDSGKQNSWLNDSKAVEIIRRVDYDFRPLINSIDGFMQYAYILRDIQFDRLIKDYFWRYPSGTVVNIGCGLDTTYERLKNGTVQWYDLDFSDVIKLKKILIPETENRKFIPASFLKDEWLNEIKYSNSILFLASGVFYYFNESTIRKFFAKLSIKFPSFELLFDVISPAGVWAANRILAWKGFNYGPSLKWGLGNYRTILGWNPRMRFLGKYRLFHHGFQIPLKVLMQGYISDTLSIGNVLHLKMGYDYNKM